MTKGELNNEYLDWMLQLIGCFKGLSHRKLLTRLHEIDFYYTIGMDGNRAEDGINLRYRFGYELNYADPMIAAYLDNRDCSVLEMLIALAIRCEEHIMGDPDIGDRTGLWFWTMIENLGLDSMTDVSFNIKYIDNVVQRFLDRKYDSNGEGGLFTVRNYNRDLRDVEIWYQMCWYLSSIFDY